MQKVIPHFIDVEASAHSPFYYLPFTQVQKSHKTRRGDLKR